MLTHITVKRGDIDSQAATHAHGAGGVGFALFPGLISRSWKSGTCAWKALKVGRLLEEFLILSVCRRTTTACHFEGWMRVRVLFVDAGKHCLALINS